MINSFKNCDSVTISKSPITSEFFQGGGGGERERRERARAFFSVMPEIFYHILRRHGGQVVRTLGL